ncbi:MAG: hypothetical protein AAFR11_13480 [Pseudomonadota bacterium]
MTAADALPSSPAIDEGDLARICEEFRTKGRAFLKGLVPPEVAAGMTYQAQIGAKKPKGPALATPNVSKKSTIELYGFMWPSLLGLHWGLTPAVEAASGARLLPTYAYFRTYQRGDICKVHIDRPSCEHSLSLTIGYSDGAPWGLSVGREEWDTEKIAGKAMLPDFGDEPHDTFEMQPGDGVLYKGCERRHGRAEPNPNRWSAHLFLHWVDRDGPNAEWAFDKQQISADGDFAFPG